VYSGLIGIEKPDPRIFEVARKAAGSPDPTSMLHIGDSFKKDYQAAEKVGWHALLIDRFSSPDAKLCAAQNGNIVKDLNEVKKWISERGLL
jgi:FMN phosphatase YigB (HAD superfamily)